MADTKTPYDIKVRRSLYDVEPASTARRSPGHYRDLDDLDAAGIVAADEDVTVTAVYAAEEEGNHPGEPVGALAASVYVWQGEAVTRWSSSELTFADKRGTLAMRQVLARAQRIADLANDLAAGTPIPMDGPVDHVVDEVAADMQRSWGLFHCSEASAPVLGDNLARSQARHAIARLCLIRDRDGSGPLP
jgi:hypothetical protein